MRYGEELNYINDSWIRELGKKFEKYMEVKFVECNDWLVGDGGRGEGEIKDYF